MVRLNWWITHSKTLPTWNKVTIKCTVHYIVHLQYTYSFSSLSLSLSLSLVSKKVSDSDVSAWVRDKGRWVKYWAHFGCWISPCYGPLSLSARFETYEPFISLIFQLFSGRSKLRILNQWIRGLDCSYFLYTIGFNTEHSTFSVRILLVCFIWISKITEIFSLQNIKWQDFTT
jgi:hypothetical protein